MKRMLDTSSLDDVLLLAAGVRDVVGNHWKEALKNRDFSAGAQVAVLLLIGAASYVYLSVYKKKEDKQRLINADDAELIGKPSILAIGTANPPYAWGNEQCNIAIDWKINQMKTEHTAFDDDFIDFMRRVQKTSGVETRYCGDRVPSREELAQGAPAPGIYAHFGNPTAKVRHTYWAEWAPKMAIDAATKAVNKWGGNKNKITHVIFHSCTGFKAPGVELDVIDALKLKGVKRKMGINYMGCFGGFTGMAVAKAFCEADPKSVVLVVCAETCYAHISFDENRSKSIGNSFFADGAAAAVIGAGKPGDWALTDNETKTLGPETRQMMTWQPNDHNYDMYLDKGIGLKFGMHLFWNLKSYLREVCPHSARDIEWCVHPGGKAILDFFASEKLNLGIDKSTLQRSYDVLRNYGNMSSGTIFFVLERLLQDAKENPEGVKPTAVCFGFGPGLTLEIAQLRRIGAVSAANRGGVLDPEGVTSKSAESMSPPDSDSETDPYSDDSENSVGGSDIGAEAVRTVTEI